MIKTRLFPKPDPSLLVLTSLAGGPKHGYALMKDIEGFSRLTLGPGTVFGCLARLEERGLVRALDPEDRRRPYELTAVGLAVLNDQLDELSRVTSTSMARLRRRRGLAVMPSGGPADG
ncbi:MAG TPA: PadR family transcriptional regulator [Acidimicrobiales bacterium]|nr:PadR family transcriptional regulator [Acidimicrobiales bacterium]